MYVFSTLGTYTRSLFWPAPLTIEHIGFVSRLSKELPIQSGAGTIIFWGFLLIFFWHRNKKIFALFCWILIAWLPTSNLIPLRVFFADRFLYSLLIPFSILISFVSNEIWMASRKAGTALIILVLAMTCVNFERTRNYLPVWKNDRSLWIYAISVNPRDSMAWMKIADFEFSIHREMYDDKNSINFAEDAFKNALKIGLPVWSAGYSFLKMAEINLIKGKFDVAEGYAARAIALRPEYKTRWNNMRAFYKNSARQNLE